MLLSLFVCGGRDGERDGGREKEEKDGDSGLMMKWALFLISYFPEPGLLMGRVEQGLFKWTCHRVPPLPTLPKLMEKSSLLENRRGIKIGIRFRGFHTQ